MRKRPFVKDTPLAKTGLLLGNTMKRRDLLIGGAVVPATLLQRPAIARGDPRVLRFVPVGTLTHPDPIATRGLNARNNACMIWDSLYGQTISGEVTPQMIAAHEVSGDGRTWRFTLREGLLFHDNEPVRAADCVASFSRWAQLRSIGQKLLTEMDQIRAIDDRRFEIATKQPFPRLPELLGRDTFFVVMPERLAKTPPLKQINEFIGSGPFRFLTDEWEPGARVAYARFDKYVSRPEASNFLSGGKRVTFDRVEWTFLPDPATAAAALQRGEVDWVQRPLPDLLPVLRKADGVDVLPPDKYGQLLLLSFNHLQPPFNNRKLLRALLPAIDQGSCVQAAVGSDPSLGRAGIGFFTPGFGMDSDVGLGAVTGPRDSDRARELVASSGYNGEKVVIISPSDVPELRAGCEVTNEMFTRIGLNVDYAALDSGTVETRRLSREPVEKAGWSAHCIIFEGLGAVDPASHGPLRGNGLAAFPGWPTSPELESLRDHWFAAPDMASQREFCRDMQRVAWEQIPYMPLGQLFFPMAVRSDIKDVLTAPFPIFWNVRRG